MLNEASPPAFEPPRADELLADGEDASGLLVAVSGGPDSVALLLLADQWRKKPGRPSVFAATVDHGLRPGSRMEAETVGNWCRALGMAHFVLPWSGPKPTTRLQERARDVRYALLGDCARGLGASMLLTAHHADDQYETVLFRLLRGSAIAGLAGMARRTPRGDLIHARPLLDLPKSALVGFCDSLGHPYFRDPSNEDPRFARTRLRQAASVLADLGFGSEGLLRLSKRAARAEAALRVLYAEFARSAVLERAASRTRLSGRALAEAPEELVLRMICEETSRLTGRDPPRMEKAETLVAALRRALDAGAPLRATLGGVLFSLSDQGLELRSENPRRGQDARFPPNDPSNDMSRTLDAPLSPPAHSLVKGGQDA